MNNIVTRHATGLDVRQVRAMFVAAFREAEQASYVDMDEAMLEIVGVSFVADEDHIFGAPNEEYIKAELDWYLSKSLNVNDIPGGPPKIWRDVADVDGNINSNYGYLLFSEENYSQFDRVVNTLRLDPTSRQAIAIYTRPTIHTDAFDNGRSDFICTNTVQYLIRGNRVHVVVNMRSNDAVFGYRNDVAWQKFTQALVVAKLQSSGMNVDSGKIFWQVGSLHVYPRHVKLVEHFKNANDHEAPVHYSKRQLQQLRDEQMYNRWEAMPPDPDGKPRFGSERETLEQVRGGTQNCADICQCWRHSIIRIMEETR